MNRHDEILNAYHHLGKEATFYDGMITCSRYSAKLSVSQCGIWIKRRILDIWKGLFLVFQKNFSGRLLEVPVGTGVLTMPVYKTLSNADITCLDYSTDMMEKAQHRTKGHELNNVKFMQGDVRKLPFTDENFDLVISLNGFHAFPDKEAAYSETFRVLKFGGIFCGCFYIQGENRRTDWFIKHLYTPKGFFTPPFETLDSLRKRLKSLHKQVELEAVESIVCFTCKK